MLYDVAGGSRAAEMKLTSVVVGAGKERQRLALWSRWYGLRRYICGDDYGHRNRHSRYGGVWDPPFQDLLLPFHLAFSIGHPTGKCLED